MLNGRFCGLFDGTFYLDNMFSACWSCTFKIMNVFACSGLHSRIILDSYLADQRYRQLSGITAYVVFNSKESPVMR